MRGALIGLFGLVFGTTVTVTVRSSLPVGVWDALPGLLEDPWAVATLLGVCLGFLIICVRLACKEPPAGRRTVRFPLEMGPGNITTSLYLLMQPVRLQPGHPAWETPGREP